MEQVCEIHLLYLHPNTWGSRGQKPWVFGHPFIHSHTVIKHRRTFCDKFHRRVLNDADQHLHSENGTKLFSKIEYTRIT